jgi:hypothetical protein
MASGMYVNLPICRLPMLNTLTSFNSTYYGKDYRAGAALLRARRPFLVKNALTGFGLFAFTIGVCTLLLSWSPRLPLQFYSRRAVSCHKVNCNPVVPPDT